jgi:hypothetical protein
LIVKADGQAVRNLRHLVDLDEKAPMRAASADPGL